METKENGNAVKWKINSACLKASFKRRNTGNNYTHIKDIAITKKNKKNEIKKKIG